MKVYYFLSSVVIVFILTFHNDFYNVNLFTKHSSLYSVVIKQVKNHTKTKHSSKTSLTPDFNLSNLKSKMKKCTDPKRIIELNFKQKAGLTDRTGKIVLLSKIACRLNAKIIVTQPCKSLTPFHNNGNKIPCESRWSDYIDFFTFRKVNNQWMKCEDSILLSESKHRHRSQKTVVKKISPKLLKDKYDTDEPFHWVLDMSEYNMHASWIITNNTLPLNCNVERFYGRGILNKSLDVIKNNLQHTKYMGLKIRMGDDVSRTKKCSDPNKIKDFIKKMGFDSDLNIYTMMEPDNKYKNILLSTMKTANITFETDIINGGDNYEKYLESYYILEHAPLGRIEIRRLETSDPKYNKDRTCSLRFFPPINTDILMSGFGNEYIDYDDL